MRSIKFIYILIAIFICLNPKELTSATTNSSLEVNIYITQDTLTQMEYLALFMGQVYYLSNPLFELNDYSQFNEWLKTISQKVNLNDLFSSNGQMINTFRTVGNKMVQSGIRSFSPQDQNWAYGRALEMGADMDQARKISSDVNQGSLDIWTYGMELVWLADVLPEYVIGNKVPFFNTGAIARNAIRENLPYLRIMGSEYILEYLKPYGPYMIYESAIIIFNYIDN